MGRVKEGARGPMLEADDGSIWILEIGTDLELQIGKKATVEGNQVGLDRLAVEWIGPASRKKSI